MNQANLNTGRGGASENPHRPFDDLDPAGVPKPVGHLPSMAEVKAHHRARKMGLPRITLTMPAPVSVPDHAGTIPLRERAKRREGVRCEVTVFR